MRIREDLYAPIAGSNPAGGSLCYEPVYDRVKEARREEDDLNQGAWAHERKVADHELVIKLTQEAIATRSKDLQLAAWLAASLLHRDGAAGLLDGLMVCQELIVRFWDHLYPEAEDGDLELRATPLEWLGGCTEGLIGSLAVDGAGHKWFEFKESRQIGYEDQAKDPNQKKAREKLVKSGKVPPEDIDKAFKETPKVFYARNEEVLDACLGAVRSLKALCDEKFGAQSPGFGRMESALTEVRHTIHQFLEKKRETEPDPVPEEPASADTPVDGESMSPDLNPAEVARVGGIIFAMEGAPDPPDRRQAIQNVAEAAALLRKKDPASPAPYLMMRGLRWGELRAAAELSDPRLLEAPPMEARRLIKRLALDGRWKELLETAENFMAFPYSRAWLDLQRFTVEACIAIGPSHDAIAKAIRSGLRTLIHDVPQLLDATLMDDTAAANAETRKWLGELLEEPGMASTPRTPREDRASEGFRMRFIDSFSLAQAALRAGEAPKAFEMIRDEIARQRSGRGRFLRRLEMVRLCVAAGKDAIAQPILEDLVAALDAHKIEDWEDRETVADALTLIMSASKKVQGDAKEKQKYFERICRLDPVRALGAA